MSFNKLKYDSCVYKENLKKSDDFFSYQMYDGKYDNQNKCRVDFGIVGGNDVSLYDGNMVDLESELRGQTRPGSLCSTYKYSPTFKQPCFSGLPSGELDSNSHFISLPTCKFINYNPIVYAQPSNGSFCMKQN